MSENDHLHSRTLRQRVLDAAGQHLKSYRHPLSLNHLCLKLSADICSEKTALRYLLAEVAVGRTFEVRQIGWDNYIWFCTAKPKIRDKAWSEVWEAGVLPNVGAPPALRQLREEEPH